MNISILSYSSGHIDCFINENSNCFYFTGFYGNSNSNNCQFSWNLLNKIASTHTNPGLGWLVGGNLNKILFDHEKKEGIPRAFSAINNFWEALSSNSLSKILTCGPKYTWDNKRKSSDQILVKLDRYVANPAWLASYPNFVATNLNFFNSDHGPISINSTALNLNHQEERSNPFMYNHCWLMEYNYGEILCEGWNRYNKESNFHQALELCSSILKSGRITMWVL